MKELQYPFDGSYILQHKKSLRRKLLEGGPFLKKKIALLSGSTIGEMKNILELFLLNQGIAPEFYEGEYNRYYEEIVFEEAALKEFAPDLIYIHTTNRNIRNFPAPGDPAGRVEELLAQELEHFCLVWDKCRDSFHCPVIQNNFEPMPYRVLGNRDIYEKSGASYFVHCLNGKMYGYAMEHPDFYINDINYLASEIGLLNWFDEPKWCLYKYAFSPEAIPSVAFSIANIIKALYGKNAKALALDLDNTLWGGVIGDDGVENIRLGIESSEGMAFETFQSYLKNLSRTGISLNLCSKNDEALGLEGFTHDASVLKPEDFIVKKVNWDNKDENIRRIAGELNIGEEAIVFVDDNPMERGIVSERTDAYVLPVREPESYVYTLDRSGLFECVSLSVDDRRRNEYYRANIRREKVRNTFTDYKEYLRALEMTCVVDSLNVGNIQRVTQLINKTNQFNLTTERLTMEEVQEAVKSPDTIAFAGQLIDKYGDNGLVSVVMAKAGGETAHISLWIMSCRVFKRDLELAMFDELVKRCLAGGVKKIRGYYYRTKKNGLVESFYGILGFTPVLEEAEKSEWEYVIPAEYVPLNQVMEIRIRPRHQENGINIEQMEEGNEQTGDF